MSKGIVIIGAGPAGVTTVETLRSQGYEGPITLLTREPFPPYSPPLMADYLELQYIQILKKIIFFMSILHMKMMVSYGTKFSELLNQKISLLM